MIVELKSITTKDIEAPDILYKYRCWANPYHKTILSDRIVYMAPPSSFEDEKEFRNYKRYDLMNDKDIYNKYMEFSKAENPQYTRQQHRAHARDMTKHSPIKNQRTIGEHRERTYIEYNHKLGILSLTEFNDSIEMWHKYSCEAQGFCVGFDSHILFGYMGGGGKVEYPKEGLPVIHGTDPFEVERWKQTYNKELKWEFEQEYRVDVFKPGGLSDGQRKVKLPIECYKQVVFGWHTSDEDKTSIINACNDAGLKVECLEARISGGIVTIHNV